MIGVHVLEVGPAGPPCILLPRRLCLLGSQLQCEKFRACCAGNSHHGGGLLLYREVHSVRSQLRPTVPHTALLPQAHVMHAFGWWGQCSAEHRLAVEKKGF